MERASVHKVKPASGGAGVPSRPLGTHRFGVLQRKCSCEGSGAVFGECAECKAERGAPLQRASASRAQSSAVPPIVHEVLGSSGQPLDAATRAYMEPRFGYDFSKMRVHADSRASGLTMAKVNDPLEGDADQIAEQVVRTSDVQRRCAKDNSETKPIQQHFRRDFSSVRVHTDPLAAASANMIGARAYTVGGHIVFGNGQFAPGAMEGKRLLAHELAHTLQQTAFQRTDSGLILQRATLDESTGSQESTAAEPEEEQEQDQDQDQAESTEAVIESEDDTKIEADSSEACAAMNEIIEREDNQADAMEQLGPGPHGNGGHGKKYRPKPTHSTRKERKQCNIYGFIPAKSHSKGVKGKRKRKHKQAAKKKPHCWCVTKYRVKHKKIEAGHQPMVHDKETRQNITLPDDCWYEVQWDMFDVPDQIIITNTDTQEQFDSGMTAGEGKHAIRGPAKINIHVIPNDGTDNPDHKPTQYKWKVVGFCDLVKKITICHLKSGTARASSKIPYNPNKDYSKSDKVPVPC